MSEEVSDLSYPTPRPTSIVIVIGLGWAYLIEELVSLISSDSNIKIELYFYEPIPQVYQILREKGRLIALEANNITIFDNLTELLSKAKNKQAVIPKAGDFLSYISPAYKRLFPNLIEDVQKITRSIDETTANVFLRQWTRNAFSLIALDSEKKTAKLNFISKSRFPETIKKIKKPVVYCGASATLIEDIKCIPLDAFVISSDTSLAPLIAHKCQIDLAICVDSSNATFYHLKAAYKFSNVQKSLFNFPVLSWSGGIRSLDKWFSKVYYYRSTLPFDQIMGLGPLSKLDEWKNLSRNPLGLALYIAYLLGTDSLYCLGTSFELKDGKSHERGTGYQEYAIEKVSRIFSLEMYRPKSYQNKNRIEKNNYDKNTLAWEGALKLASKLGIGLKKSDELKKLAKRGLKVKDKSMKNEKLSNTNKNLDDLLACQEISKKELRSFLIKQRQFLNMAELKKIGLAETVFDKYMQLIK